MALVLAYTNRLRNVLRIDDDTEVDSRGLPTGTWQAHLKNVSFWVRIPGESDRDNEGWRLVNDRFAGVGTDEGMLSALRRQSRTGDWVVIDWDSKSPRYYIRTARGLKSVAYDSIPENLKQFFATMDAYGIKHLCYGEKINPDCSVVGYRSSWENFNAYMTSNVAGTDQDLWALEEAAYFVDGVEPDRDHGGERVVLSNEAQEIPSDVLNSPESNGIPLYIRRQPGEMAGFGDHLSAVLVQRDSGEYSWAPTDCSGLVTDEIVRVYNPDLFFLTSDDEILHGDFILHSDKTCSVASEPSYLGIPPGCSSSEFVAASVVGQRVGNRDVLRFRNRQAPDDVRQAMGGYRFLNRDDHVQEGDFEFTDGGGLKKPDCIGKKLSSNSNNLIRAIGKDGWGVIVRDQITEDMEVQWQVRDRGKVWIDWTPWVQSRDSEQLQEYERQYYTVYFRKKVAGFRAIRRGDPNFQLPYGLAWVIEGESIPLGALEIINGELRPASRATVGKVCSEPHIYVKAEFNQYHNTLPFPSILTQATPVVECLGKFIGSNPTGVSEVQVGSHQMVVSRHGISLVPLIASHMTGQETPIGTFFPYVFKINGVEQIMYCTDQVENSQLSSLVSQGITSMLGAVQRHLPFLNIIPATVPAATTRREVRAIEL